MTLTETAAFTKKAFIVGFVFFFLVILAWIGYQYWYYKIYVPSLPPKVEKPTLKFGILPRTALPKSKTESSLTYTLNTETGSLPETPKLARVYPIAQLATDLLALDRAKNLAGLLGFSKTPEKLTVTEFRFNSDTGGTLIINLDTGNFKSQRPLASESASIAFDDRESFVNPERLGGQLKNYLSTKNLLKDQLKEGRTKVSYNQKKDIAEVNLWQENIEEIPIVTESFTEGLIKSTIANLREDDKKYLKIDYTYWPIDKDNQATYPIKKIDDAYSELQEGKGSIVVAPQGNSVSITSVYLAYLLTKQYYSYLEPVFVFEGENFVAYVQALTEDYLEK